MKFAVNVWEYDVRQAGKSFLEHKGFKLSDNKEEYVVQVGLIFKDKPHLREEFVKELESYLLQHIGNRHVIRYYVDEIIVDKRIDRWNDHPYFQVRERFIKFLLIDSNNNFVKVYNDGIKISKGFTLQAPDLWLDIANVMSDITKIQVKHQNLAKVGHKYCSFKYPDKNYLVRFKKGGYGIVYKNNLIVKYESYKENIKVDKQQLSKSFYYQLLHKYLIFLF